ncbi:efflux transporter, RND family, MFP subunit [Thalassoporum mexicanum PCC 7367]|uniref:efflux RND transporter periplasmic adaptor subunit n=1 Tax=Thalassoporum mexicanum TaxID=3457544 RepID=UPI00029F9EA5|nr:efflux RND transporter periplasmic adaptor subunit [Pseudanabaena sp. PCC 7367]AFY70825.1 efflux transporter, RND family, MFP subunit [Pseudanabaena sp. PCC 7367]
MQTRNLTKLGNLTKHVGHLGHFGKLSITAFSVAMLGACQGGPPPGSGGQAIPVEIKTVELGDIQETTEYIANLNSRESVTLQPRVSGQIAQILVQAGDYVEAGTPIIQIDPTEQQAALLSTIAAVESAAAAAASTQARLEDVRSVLRSLEASKLANLSDVALNQRDLQRDAELVQEGAITQRDLDTRVNSLERAQATLGQVEQEIEAQKARVLAAEADLARSERLLVQAQADAEEQQALLGFYGITAPFAGTVGDIPVKVGDFVDSGTQLLTITQNEQLEVEINIPIERSPELQVGLPVVLLDSNNNILGESQISFIAPNTETVTQSILVKAIFDNAEELLRADQFVRARIVWSEGKGVLIPTSSISRLGGQNFVFQAVPPEEIEQEEPPEGTEADPEQAQRSPIEATPANAQSSEDSENQGPPTFIAVQKPVKLGRIQGNSYHVLEGLEAGDQLVTSGILKLTDGAPVMRLSDLPPMDGPPDQAPKGS